MHNIIVLKTGNKKGKKDHIIKSNSVV